MKTKPEGSVIPKIWTSFPEAIRVRLGRGAGPQRAMMEEGHLLIILHHLPQADEHDRRAAIFWRQPTGEWKTNADGIGAMAIQKLLDSYESAILSLEDAEDKANSAKAYHSVLEGLAPLLRAARGLHRALQQARELMKEERELINFRDSAAALERSAELLLQDAQFGLDFVVAKQAEAQAEVAERQAAASHKLNILAALFLPLTTLASVFGMSLKIPGDAWPQTFWAVACTGIIMGTIMCTLVMRGKK